MTHRENSRAFSRRYGRCFWKRAAQFSSADKPAPVELASAGVTGSAEGSTSAATDNGASAGSSPEQRGSHEVAHQQATPPSTHSAGGGVCCLMLAAQVHADRWATLAVIAVFLCGFAIAAIRANRSSRPTTPPLGPFAGRRHPRTDD